MFPSLLIANGAKGGSFMKCTTCKKRMQLVSVSYDFVIKGKGIKVVNIPAEQSSGGGRVEVSGSKGILTSDTYGLLRTLCSRNPKIRPIRATFSCFAGPKVMLFHASMKKHDLLTLVS